MQNDTPKTLPAPSTTGLIHHPYTAPAGFEAPQPGVFKASTVYFPTVADMRSSPLGASRAAASSARACSAAAHIAAQPAW